MSACLRDGVAEYVAAAEPEFGEQLTWLGWCVAVLVVVTPAPQRKAYFAREVGVCALQAKELRRGREARQDRHAPRLEPGVPCEMKKRRGAEPESTTWGVVDRTGSTTGAVVDRP